MVTSMLWLTILTLSYVLQVNANGGSYPMGHMQPLGAHQPPGEVEEREDLPTAEEFWNNYVQPSKAVVFRGLAKEFPLFNKWTDDYMRSNFGNLEIGLEVTSEKQPGTSKGTKDFRQDTLTNFIDTYHEEGQNTCAVTQLPTPMYKDVIIPSFLGCGTLAERLVEVDLWITGKETSGPLHKDPFNAINCLFNGTKEWKLIEYKHEEKIYKVWHPENEVGGFSHIDPEEVDLIKYPTISEVPWSHVTMNAGDCLFLPKRMYHHVTSRGKHNHAIIILFSRFDGIKKLKFDDCGHTKHRPLSDFDIDWNYPGHGIMSRENSDLEYTTRKNLLELQKSKQLTLEGLSAHFRASTMSDKSCAVLEKNVSKFYEILHLEIGVEVTAKKVLELNKSDLRSLSALFSHKGHSSTIKTRPSTIIASQKDRNITNCKSTWKS